MIIDASPLIFLGRKNKLFLLKTPKIPSAVYHEVMAQGNSTEAIALNKALQEKTLRVLPTNVHPLLQNTPLGQGEKEAISLAYREKEVLITDDQEARSYASILNVQSHGTLYILSVANKEKQMTKKEAREFLDELMTDGFYLATEVYIRFMRSLK